MHTMHSPEDNTIMIKMDVFTFSDSRTVIIDCALTTSDLVGLPVSAPLNTIGFAVGTEVGSLVHAVGGLEGLFVGDSDGCFVGFAVEVGCSVGIALGFTVGSVVGDKVGSDEG